MGWEASEHQRVDSIGLGQSPCGLGEPPGMALRGLVSAGNSLLCNQLF